MGTPDADLTARLELALEASRQAGQITLEHFRRDDLKVERKADDSPVTVADRLAEEHLRGRIAAAFPGDALLGEEFPERPGTSGFRWILDPIDGTKSFIHGVPLYSTLVGVEHHGRPTIGVIHIPALDECVYAMVGHGAWRVDKGRSPQPARVSTCDRLADGLLLTSELASFDEAGCREVFERLHATARLCRTWGDGYGYLMVATGRAEVMIDPILNVWDAAALLPVIQEAGGTYTDWQGNPSIRAGNGVATNGRLRDEILAVTRTKK